jgi:hypothetical protein
MTLYDFNRLNINRELVLEFFLAFSCFEFALKNAGFAQPSSRKNGRLPSVNPGWDSFAASVRGKFQRNRNPKLNSACEYILENPPLEQVWIDNGLAWETNNPCESVSEVECLLRFVRRVRNNLFHGAKFSGDAFEDTSRQEMLLKNCLLILAECLEISPQVQSVYKSGAI